MTLIYNKTTNKEKRRSLRKIMPSAEVLVWNKLRAKQLFGYKFRRQYSVGPYILDFYCPEFRLAIEIDGDSHTDAEQKYDKQRQSFIESFGIHFLRFTNSQVYESIDSLLELIAKKIEELKENTLTSPNPFLVRRGEAKQK